MQGRVGLDKAHEGLELLVFVLAHGGDEGLGAGVAEGLPVVAHDLEGAPAGGLGGAGGIQQAGLGQALVLGTAAGVATGQVLTRLGCRTASSSAWICRAISSSAWRGSAQAAVGAA